MAFLVVDAKFFDDSSVRRENKSLQSQLAASKKRERILRDGLESIRDGSSLPVYCAVCTMKRADEVEP